jgi:hypothetical protein
MHASWSAHHNPTPGTNYKYSQMSLRHLSVLEHGGGGGSGQGLAIMGPGYVFVPSL